MHTLQEKLENNILDIIAHKDDYTQSDIQGLVQSQVMLFAREMKVLIKSELTFEDKLEISKDQELQ